MALHKQDTEKQVKSFGTHTHDTGSTPVQVALLTERIRLLTGHLKLHKKDVSSKRGLLIMISRRHKLLKYLKRKNEVDYKKVVKELQLRS